MPLLRLEIIRFVDEHQPGIIECSFNDAYGQLHRIIDKLPLFTMEDLWSDSIYPRSGVARCELLEKLVDKQQRKTVKITLARPDDLESTSNQSEFIVFESQVSDIF